MKKRITAFLFTLLALGLQAQENVDSLIRKGIEFHDNRQYNKAIETYKIALEIDSKSTLINYEMAMTYMYAKEYKKSIKHCNFILKENKEHLLQAYTTKGSCLDYLGKSEKAIETYEEALQLFSDNYLLNYNLGYTYYAMNNFNEADKYFLAALNLKPSHTSSHILLGVSKYKQNNRVQSLLSLHYFLLLETNTNRSKYALQLIDEQKKGNVSVDENNSNNITIEVSQNSLDDSYASADMMLAMLEASRKIDDNVSKSETELFLEETKSFFTVLGELRNEKTQGFWWDFYVPFFYDLSKSKHLETYCFYIKYSTDEDAKQWIDNNPKKHEEMNSWISNWK